MVLATPVSQVECFSSRLDFKAPQRQPTPGGCSHQFQLRHHLQINHTGVIFLPNDNPSLDVWMQSENPKLKAIRSVHLRPAPKFSQHPNVAGIVPDKCLNFQDGLIGPSSNIRQKNNFQSPHFDWSIFLLNYLCSLCVCFGKLMLFLLKFLNINVVAFF